MKTIDEIELTKQIKEKTIAPIYFLFGSEEKLISHYADTLVKACVGKNPSDFDFVVFDFESTCVDEIVEFALSLPFTAEKKCVLGKNLNIEKLNAVEFSKLCELLEEPSEYCVLIFLVQHDTVDLKKAGKVKTLLELISKVGHCVRLDSWDKPKIIKFLQQNAKKNNCVIENDVCYELINYCGTGLSLLTNELDKLCCFVLDGVITKEDIKKIVPKTLDASVFTIAKALMRGDAELAFSELSELFYMKEPPVLILGALSGSYVDLYRAKVFLANGKNCSEAITAFSYYAKKFVMENAFRDCSKFSLNYLRECLSILLEADTLLKSSKLDDKLIIEQALSKIIHLKISGV